jgi:chaperone modulatory protein CbpM
MRIHVTDANWLNESDICSIEHFAELSGMSLADVQELVECGAIRPAQDDVERPSYSMQEVSIVIAARRLRDDFELDQHGLEVALSLLRRIRALEAELQTRQWVEMKLAQK